MFVDEATIEVEGGRGGDGCMSMLREKYRDKGGPAGGTGGRGGAVILRASRNQNTLLALRGRAHARAEPGASGGPKDRTGKRGADLRLEVPVGTVVKDASTGAVLADLAEEGAQLVVAPGGRGGRGNKALVTEAEPLPRWAEKGEPGAVRKVTLELKVMADVGLLGLPNAGKSTLLSVLSNARPKVAAYPFTTLEPQLGTVAHEVSRGGRGFVVADIPGLVQGAHEGTGLGDRFLRHLDRTRLLLHLVDVSGSEGRDPVDAYKEIRRELGLYHDRVADKPEIVVATKMDVTGAAEAADRLARKTGKQVFRISSVTHAGVDALVEEVLRRLDELPEGPETFDPTPVFRLGEEEAGRPFEVEQVDADFWVVHGGEVDVLVQTHDLEDPEALEHMDKKLRHLGVYEELGRRGAREGHTVRLGDFLFDYIPE